jgi:hypothetical protein
LNLVGVCALAQESGEPDTGTAEGYPFEMDIPEGFHELPTDEPGIYRWEKDSAGIFVVVGTSFVEPTDKLFQELLNAARKNDEIESAETLKVPGAKAFVYKEKRPDDSSRPRTWRLIAVTDEQVINVDFTAPDESFNTFAESFERALRSFRLNES